MKATMFAIISAGLLVSGCATTGGGAFRSDGVPAKEYYVGGGYQVYYSAPVAGTAYLVEESSGKLLVTESLRSGEMFTCDFDPTSEESQSIFKTLGIEPAQAKLSLYFVPEGGKVPGQTGNDS